MTNTEGLILECVLFEILNQHSDRQAVGHISLECRSEVWAKVINTINKQINR